MTLGLAGALLLVAGIAREATGHAVPVAAEPAENAVLAEAPPEIVIRFSERVDPRASALEVLDGHGQRVDHGGAAVDPADPWRYHVGVHGLTAGVYTVTWRVLSADDGHVTHGAHVFAVGTGFVPSLAPPAAAEGPGLRPLVRWLVAVGGALLVGVPLAVFWLGPGMGTAPSTAPLVGLGGALVLVGGTLDLVLQAWGLAGDRPVTGVLRALLSTRSGHVWLFRTLALTLLAAGWAARRSPGAGGRWPRLAGLALGVGVVVSGGVVTHSATVVEGRALALGIETLHLVATAVWVGGLVGFGLLLQHAAKARTAAAAETTAVALAIPAFSQLAIPAVGALAISGLALARLHLTTWTDLVGTPYGRWLVAKLMVFAALLALGAYHQQRVHRRLRDAVAGGSNAGATAARFRRSLAIEAGLGLVALLLAAALASTSPTSAAVASTSPGFRLERSSEVARIALEVTPLRPGPNRIRLSVKDPAGRPLTDATAALVQLVPADGGVGPVTFPLARTGSGTFETSGAVIGIVGRWDGRLVVQRDGAYDINDRFEMVLAETPPTHDHAHGRALPLDAVTAWSTAGITLATAALWAGSWRTRRMTRRLVADADRVAPPHLQGGST
jgi:copper transport protein